MNRNDLIRRGDVMDVLEKLVWNGEISATVALKIAGVAAETPVSTRREYWYWGRSMVVKKYEVVEVTDDS